MTKLADVRKRIDQTDKEIVELLEKRAQLALAVRGIKSRDDMSVYSPAREREILERVQELGSHGQFPLGSLSKIFRTILSATRSLVGELTVAYVGPEGSMEHAAALKQFGGDVLFQPESRIEDVFQRVASGEVLYGVVPYETAATGLEPATLRLLKDTAVRITAEVPYGESLGLWSTSKSLKDVKKVFAEPVSLMVSRRWLLANTSDAEIVLVQTNAEAVLRALEEGGAAILSIDSEHAQGDTRLACLASGVEERSSRNARLLVIGNEEQKQSGKDKTALFCFTEDRAGALRAILDVFAEESITLRKVESKPLEEEAGSYYFFIECVGHEKDPAVARALESLGKISSRFKILGSYPVPPAG